MSGVPQNGTLQKWLLGLFAAVLIGLGSYAHGKFEHYDALVISRGERTARLEVEAEGLLREHNEVLARLTRIEGKLDDLVERRHP